MCKSPSTPVQHKIAAWKCNFFHCGNHLQLIYTGATQIFSALLLIHSFIRGGVTSVLK